MKLAFYRKYRPNRFSEVIGQHTIVEILTNAVSAGSVGHAYLFTGPRGVGKTTLARLLAKAVNCPQQKKGEACGECVSCKAFRDGTSLDLIEIDAASNRGIDDIRELKEGIRFSPTSSKYKVYIVDEVHMLTKEAFNALLKTLEEPPEHAIFVLATTEVDRVPATIVSRCQRFDFKKLKIGEIAEYLKRIAEAEQLPFEAQALKLLAANAEGSVRDAVSMLEKLAIYGNASLENAKEALGLVDVRFAEELTTCIEAKDLKKAFALLQGLSDDGQNLANFAKSLVSYLRHVLIAKISPDLLESLHEEFSPEQVTTIEKFSKSFKEEELQRLLKGFIEAQMNIRYTEQQMLPLELALVEYVVEKK